MTLLILGGTSEAAELARRLARDHADVPALVSLAGRTSRPAPLALPMRVGGFGGAQGLARFIAAEGVSAVVDATHPFAAVMPFNAEAACRAAGVPLLALRRPPWRPVEGDRWTEVATMAEAVAALGGTPRRVFLTVGRLELRPFAAAPQHAYLVRTIEPLGDVLSVPRLEVIEARGPFRAEDEEALMRSEGIEVLVTKNSGGGATEGKLLAARRLGLAVVMVARPAKPAVPTAETVDALLALLRSHGLLPAERGV